MDGEHNDYEKRDPFFLGQDGRSASLTAPNGPAQERCLQVAIACDLGRLGNFRCFE